MKKRLFGLLCLLWCGITHAQTGRLLGFVQDAETKSPLERATVSVLGADSGLIAYQLSDANGRFLFEKLPLKKSLQVSVTYAGYAAHRIPLQLRPGKTDTVVVNMTLNANDSNAVVISTTAPVRMNGDTLEINPAAFKTGPNAVVEELLNQVSGITIWSDGSITVNGRKVQSLLVDGKPFLGSNDTRVATQNLPKTAIEKIQLYQEYDRTQIGRESLPQDSLLTMNIKLKESAKKGYFGKAGGGYGTTNRFEADLTFQVYNKRSSIGLGGGINNINKNIGSIQEMFQNNTYRNINPNLYNVGRFGTNGINRNYTAGTTVNHNFIESTNSRQNNRLTVNYTTAGTNSYLTDLLLQTRTTVNNPQEIREEGVQTNRNHRHDLGVNYVRTNSYNDNLNLSGNINNGNDNGRSARITEVMDTAARLQSRNRINTVTSRRSNNASVNAMFAKSDEEELIKGFTLVLSARQNGGSSSREVESVFQSFVDAGKNTAYTRRYLSDNESVALSANLNYQGLKRLLLRRYNLFGINLTLTQQFSYNRSSDKTKVSDFDSTSKRYNNNEALSNQNRRELVEYAPALNLSKAFWRRWGAGSSNLYLQARLINEWKGDKNGSSIAKRNLNRSFQFFRYEGNLSYNRTGWEKYQCNVSASYTKTFEYPSVDLLYTIVDDINAYEIRVGNPRLRNRVNHQVNLNGNFNTQKPQSVYAFNGSISGSFTRSIHPVTDSIINDPSGKRITYYVNADQSSRVYLTYSLNLSRRLGKSQAQLHYNGQYNTGSSPNYIDGVYNTSENSNLSNQLSLQVSIRSALVLNLAQSLQHLQTRQSAAGLNAFKNTNSTTRAGIVVNPLDNLSFSSTLDRIANANLARPTVLWNAFLTYRFMKQQSELKFSAMDILKQYQSITNNVYTYGTTTRITNGLQQFFLVTLSYFPRKFGKMAGAR